MNGAHDAPIDDRGQQGPAKASTCRRASDGMHANDTDLNPRSRSLSSARFDGAAATVGHTIAGTYGRLTSTADGS